MTLKKKIEDVLTAEQAQEVIQAAEALTERATGRRESLTLSQAIRRIRIAGETAADAERKLLDSAQAILDEAMQEVQKHTEEQEAQEDTGAPRYEITLDMSDHKPELDPGNPAFDAEAYKEALAAAGGTEALNAAWQSATQRLQDSLTSAWEATNPATLQAIADTARAAVKRIADFLQSDAYTAIKSSIATLNAYWQDHAEEIAALAEIATEAHSLAPFLEDEIAADPALAGRTLEEAFTVGFDEDGNVTDSPFKQAIERARQRRAEIETVKETVEAAEQAAEELPRIISNPTELLTYPLDKPNTYIWNLLEGADGSGQLSLDIDTRKKGSSKEAIILYGISFDELETGLTITKQLTPFDKRVYIAAAALFNGGNSVISATQIYKMMGNRGQPKAEQIQKINDSITKMGAARVYIDSTGEVQTNKRYTAFKYDAALLPFERISAYINNTMTEAAIHLFREPPLITFARERGQITSLTRQLLESPISKTDANLRLEDYLLERIGHMNNPKSKAPRKMLFATIYERCHITGKTEKDRKERQRTPEKIRKYLDHYKQCGFIKGYTMDKDSVTIAL